MSHARGPRRWRLNPHRPHRSASGLTEFSMHLMAQEVA